MPSSTTPGPKFSGLHWDANNGRLDLYYQGTRVGHFNASGILTVVGSLMTGFIPLHLTNWRLTSGGDVPSSGALDGGLVSLDTAPILKRVNAATDKNLRISWVATGVVPIQQSFAYPADLDDTAAVTVNLIVGKDTNTDTAFTIGVAYFEGVGDTNAGGNTAAITETTGQNLKTVVITAANVGAYPQSAVVELTPGTHNTDAAYLYGCFITYVRKI